MECHWIVLLEFRSTDTESSLSPLVAPTGIMCALCEQ